jgi:hypothetical protein
MSDEKWSMRRVREEIYDARVKIFVVSKVMETGNLKPQEEPEWTLVIKPLLDDILEHTGKLKEMLELE